MLIRLGHFPKKPMARWHRWTSVNCRNCCPISCITVLFKVPSQHHNMYYAQNLTTQYVFCMRINLKVLNSTHTVHPEVTGSGLAGISTPWFIEKTASWSWGENPSGGLAGNCSQLSYRWISLVIELSWLSGGNKFDIHHKLHKLSDLSYTAATSSQNDEQRKLQFLWHWILSLQLSETTINSWLKDVFLPQSYWQ